jgi:hypothetical protein
MQFSKASWNKRKALHLFNLSKNSYRTVVVTVSVTVSAPFSLTVTKTVTVGVSPGPTALGVSVDDAIGTRLPKSGVVMGMISRLVFITSSLPALFEPAELLPSGVGGEVGCG